jgi:D-sedoheptulose 7-phosphate isomerase
MHREYLDDFVDALGNAVFTVANGAGAGQLAGYEEGIQALVDVFTQAKQGGNTAYFAGNGGSAAIASHMTSDFRKNGNMKTGALLDASVITCFGNDFGYDRVYSKQIEQLGQAGDILVGISSSGNSMNIVNAIEEAKRKGMKVITLSGFRSDNKIRQMGDINVYVAREHYGIVESVHVTMLQQVVDVLLERDGALV